MRDTPRRPNPGAETNETPGIPKPSQDNRTGDATQDKRGQQPDEAQPENKQPDPAREPLRRPGAARGVDPRDLQSLLDYRDERARAESRLDRAKQLEYDDRRHRTKSPEPNSASPLKPAPSESPRSRDATPGDGRPKQTGDPTTGSRPSHEPLRRPGALPPVDPKDLQSLLDYRDERARAESRLDRAKRLEYEDRRRHLNVPEPDEPPPTTQDGSAKSREATAHDELVPGNGSGQAATAVDADARRSNSPAQTAPPDGVTRAKATAEPGSPSRPTADMPSQPGISEAIADDERPSGSSAEAAAPTLSDRGDDTRAEQSDSRPELAEPDLPDLVDAGWQAAKEADSGPDLSNRIRQPREGDINYIVDDPDNLARTITDIDLIKGGILWEVKRVRGDDPRMDTDAWISEHVHAKLDRYVDARQYLEAYKTAPIGLLFINPGTTPDFRARVESAVDDWGSRNDGESIKVRWAV